MYDSYLYHGKTLAEWQKELGAEYSLGELYRLAKDGADLQKLVLAKADIITEP